MCCFSCWRASAWTHTQRRHQKCSPAREPTGSQRTGMLSRAAFSDFARTQIQQLSSHTSVIILITCQQARVSMSRLAPSTPQGASTNRSSCSRQKVEAATSRIYSGSEKASNRPLLIIISAHAGAAVSANNSVVKDSIISLHRAQTSDSEMQSRLHTSCGHDRCE